MEVDIFEGMNDQQIKATQAIEGPVEILAGAGSGKTRVLTSRIAYMIQQKIDPFSILAITFTRKAANEMKDRITKICGRKGSYVNASTFHSFCLINIIRKYYLELGYDSSPRIVSQKEKNEVLMFCIGRYTSKIKTHLNRSENPKEIINSLFARISNCKMRLQRPKDYHKELSKEGYVNDIEKEFAKLYEMYQMKMKTKSLVDFDDIITESALLVKENKRVREELQDKYRYFCVDEYQDTNYAQYVLIKQLASKTKNLFVVGDVDQSIYGWRGADISNIMNFNEDFPDAEVIKLEQNYRSTSNILNASNSVIQNNTERVSKNLWTDGDDGPKVHDVECLHNLEEMSIVSAIIKDKVSKGDHYSDFAILYRVNSTGTTYLNQLESRDIPVEYIQGNSFFKNKDVKVFIDYMSLAAEYSDQLFLDLANVPRRGIGNVTKEKLVEISDELDCNLFDTLTEIVNEKDIQKEFSITKRQLKVFTELYSVMKSILDLKDHSSIRYIADDISSILNYPENVASNDEGMEKLNVLIKDLSKTIEDFDKEQETLNIEYRNKSFSERLLDFIDFAKLEGEKPPEQRDSVKLSTIHRSKGLEFKYVIIVDCIEESLPSFYAIQDESIYHRNHDRNLDSPSVQEERRLVYVAMTRAEKELWMTHSDYRSFTGKFNEHAQRNVSRFIKEIDDEYKDIINDPKYYMKLKDHFSIIFAGKIYTVMNIHWEDEEKEIIDSVDIIDNDGKEERYQKDSSIVKFLDQYYKDWKEK